MKQKLFSSHVDAWTRLWKRGRIDLTGNLTLSKITYASMYYLLSSIPVQEDKTWPFVGMAPGGLAHGGGDEVRFDIIHSDYFNKVRFAKESKL